MKNSNGQGSISYEADRKQYRAAFIDPEGKRIRKRFATRQEAEEWLTIKRAEMYKKEYIPKSSYTVGEWVLEYLQVYAKPNVKPTTFRQYKLSSARLSPISHLNIDELNAVQLQRFFNDEFGEQNTARFQAYCLLSMVLDKAVSLEMIRKNVLNDVARPKKKKKDIEIYTKEELQTILNFLQSNAHYHRLYPLVLLAATTGMRIGEILGLKHDKLFPDHVVIDNILVRVGGTRLEQSPKTKSSIRKVTISKFVYDEIKKLGEEGTHVFHTKTLNTIVPSNIDLWWQKIQEKCGIKHRTFHALRHTHATLLLSEGIPIIEVSRRLGHSKPSTTLNIYGHLIQGYDATIPDKIDQIYGVAPTLPPSV